MTEIKLQNPPVTEKFPPLIAAPASGWPIVPATEYWPFVLAPPPPEILCQSIKYCCAKASGENRKPAMKKKLFIFLLSSANSRWPSLCDRRRAKKHFCSPCAARHRK